MEKQISNEEILLIKKQLPGKGAYQVISGMVNGTYKPNTIKAMFNMARTMNPGVLQEAKRLIEILKLGKNQPPLNSGYNRQISSVVTIKTKPNENNE